MKPSPSRVAHRFLTRMAWGPENLPDRGLSGQLRPTVPRLRLRGSSLIQMVTRPYTTITEGTYKNLLGLMNSAKTDVLFDTKGNPYTIGNADGGFAIMPLDPRDFNKWKSRSKVWQDYEFEKKYR